MSAFFHRMKRKFYSWEECMNLREVKVRMVVLWASYYGTLFGSRTSTYSMKTYSQFAWEDNATLCTLQHMFYQLKVLHAVTILVYSEESDSVPPFLFSD